MLCPFCGTDQLITNNSRSTDGQLVTWRRKKCLRCENVFTTKEKVDLSNLLVEKKSGKKVRYQRCKLFSGIYNSARERKKVDRGDVAELAEIITDIVELRIIKKGVKIISSDEIGNIIMDCLSKDYPDVFMSYFAYFRGEKGRKYIRQLLNTPKNR